MGVPLPLKYKYSRKEIRSMVDDASAFYTSRAMLQHLKQRYRASIDAYVSEFKELIDVLAPSPHMEYSHLSDNGTIFSFEVGRDFFMEVIIPELRVWAKRLDIEISYNHIMSEENPSYPAGIVCFNWAGTPGEMKIIPNQHSPIEDWKLPE
jgi:hypothetical protein